MNTKLTNIIFNNIKIIIGAMLSAAAFSLFIIPSGFCAAGVTGLSQVICRFLPFSLATTVLIINILLLILGFVVLGYEFVIKSVAVSIMFPFFLELLQPSRFHLGVMPAPISIICGGICLGCGIGIVLNAGGSAGGFDILGVVLNKKEGFPIAIVMNVCDSIVIILQAIEKPNLYSIVSGLLVIITSSICVGLFTSQSEIYAPQEL